MPLTITIATLRSHFACDLDMRISDLTATLGRVPAEDEAIAAEVWWALRTTSTLNAVWSLRCAEPVEEAHHAAVRVMVAAARTIEHFLLPNERSVYQAALLATDEWLQTPTEEKARAADKAADAALAVAFHDDELAYCAVLAAACTASAARAVLAADAAARVALSVYNPTPAHSSADAAIRAVLIA